MKETLVKHGDGFFAFEREVGGEDGAAGYADHQIDIGHQRLAFAADGNFLLLKLFQHAVAQRRRARAAAGEHQDDEGVVFFAPKLAGFKTIALVHINFIDGGDRLILDQRAGGQRGQGKGSQNGFEQAFQHGSRIRNQRA